MRATVRDVAALAGVSPKTVSNVINGGVVVRPETRERVEQALAQLDYVPNLSARGLRNGRSGAIALTLPEMGSAYSAELAQSFVELARERGWVVQLDQTGSDPARERDLVSRARAHLVDGLVLNPVVAQRERPGLDRGAAADRRDRRGRTGARGPGARRQPISSPGGHRTTARARAPTDRGRRCGTRLGVDRDE